LAVRRRQLRCTRTLPQWETLRLLTRATLLVRRSGWLVSDPFVCFPQLATLLLRDSAKGRRYNRALLIFSYS
jgi:hypothetical protein